MDGLSLTAKTIDGALTVFAVGDVDLAQADTLWAEVSALMTPGSTVVLDCSGVAFLDSIGLQILLRLTSHAGDIGARFTLGEVSMAVERVIELAGVENLLTESGEGSG